MRDRRSPFAVAALLIAVGCGPIGGTASPGTPGATGPTSTPRLTPTVGGTAAPTRLVLLTHDSFLVSDGIVEAFETEHGVDVQVVTGGDAGEMVNRAILTRDAPLADVLYGIDNTLLGRALNGGIFEPYTSSQLGAVDASLTTGLDGRVTPIDYGDVCLNYDKSAFSGNPPVPTSLSELTEPAYRGMLVVENPATSSPGLAFMLASHRQFGAQGMPWLDFWSALRQNDVLVVNDWESAYYTSFSGGAGTGDRPIVVSYATSPAAEVVFAETPLPEAPTGVITDGCFRQVEYAGVLHGTKAPELAGRFIDYMLSAEFQQDIPLNMFVFPARTGLTLPDAFVDNAAMVPDPILLDPALDSAAIQGLVAEWTDVVLR